MYHPSALRVQLTCIVSSIILQSPQKQGQEESNSVTFLLLFHSLQSVYAILFVQLFPTLARNKPQVIDILPSFCWQKKKKNRVWKG